MISLNELHGLQFLSFTRAMVTSVFTTVWGTHLSRPCKSAMVKERTACLFVQGKATATIIMVIVLCSTSYQCKYHLKIQGYKE